MSYIHKMDWREPRELLGWLHNRPATMELTPISHVWIKPYGLQSMEFKLREIRGHLIDALLRKEQRRSSKVWAGVFQIDGTGVVLSIGINPTPPLSFERPKADDWI